MQTKIPKIISEKLSAERIKKLINAYNHLMKTVIFVLCTQI